MDTIVWVEYKEKKRSDQAGAVECSYRLKVHEIEDYRLLKVQVSEVAGKVSGKIAARIFRQRLQERRRRKLCTGMRQELAGILNERDEVFLWLDESVGADSWVREILPFREFDGFFREEWVRRVLPRELHPHFVVLGEAACIRNLLWVLAPRMKSLIWIAPDNASEEALEDFGEAFYQETGLAIRLKFLPPGTTYGQFAVPDNFCREPVNILDFTEEPKIPRVVLPKGSLWLDFASDADKERHIYARGLPCSLISLRKQWKNAPFA